MIASWTAGYILMMSAVTVGMAIWRQNTLADMATPEAQSAWNDWRNKAAEQSGTAGPVQRTIPKSPQPPALILMRDYFVACLIGVIVPLSALYAFIAWVACGVMRQSGTAPNSSLQKREK
jgi:hypothetical protein